MKKEKKRYKPRKEKQLELLEKQAKAYGGELLKTRKGRSSGRTLACKSTMHLVLRSSKARGNWSFKKHNQKIKEIISRFSKKYGIKVLSMANVGNHLHFHIKLNHRRGYFGFIRAITSSICMAVTGHNRWNPMPKELKGKFWDYRPFTRVIEGYRAFLKMKDYIDINQLEGFGIDRAQAREWVKREKWQPAFRSG